MVILNTCVITINTLLLYHGNTHLITINTLLLYNGNTHVITTNTQLLYHQRKQQGGKTHCKGTSNEDASMPENADNVQMFPPAVSMSPSRLKKDSMLKTTWPLCLAKKMENRGVRGVGSVWSGGRHGEGDEGTGVSRSPSITKLKVSSWTSTSCQPLKGHLRTIAQS